MCKLLLNKRVISRFTSTPGFILTRFKLSYVTKGEDMPIQNGSEVSFHYTLTVDGKVVDSSEGKEPFQYIHGESRERILPGLLKQLEGLSTGDEKEIEVPPEEAYGAVDSDAFQEIPRSQLPSEIKPEVGMFLQVKNPTGRSLVVRIAELRRDTVVIDLNHPLAGKTLNFHVKIISIK
jgi:FKBP-type peptidyl-prolyl cis-trans isomerase SlyD